MSSTKVTKCTSCTKPFHEGQNAIQCDKCDGWLHLKAIGGGVRGSKNMSDSYERASNKDSSAFYGIEKARRGVEIRHFECRENGRFP